MKKGSSNRKGHAFENMIAKKLSLWWTNGKRDDVFIRSDSSGGRATNRSKRGQRQFGQYGDMQAADPIGQPLIDLCVIECKDGYARDSIVDLLDKDPRHKPKYEQFIKQAQQSCKNAETKYWLLIARRRGRQIMIYMPVDLWDSMINDIHTDLEDTIFLEIFLGEFSIIGTPLAYFLDHVSPRAF